MSVSGILSTNLFTQTQSIQNNQQQLFQKEFQQLGQDLQSGNLAAGQTDFATLQQATTTSSASSTNPIAQEFNQLGQDLQSGSTSAAEKDYTQLQQDLQNAVQSPGRHRHAHRETDGGSGSSNGDGATALSQLFQQLGQDLQSNNLAGAQEAYNSLLQDFNPPATGGLTPQSSGSTVSVSA